MVVWGLLEVAANNDTEGTQSDVARILLRSALIKAPLTQLARLDDGRYVYEVKYDYKLFSTEGDQYEFQIRLPFDGTQMVNGSIVKLAVLTPENADVNGNLTNGIDEQGQEIQETITQLASTGRAMVEFRYQLDPIFTVAYRHNQPVLNHLVNQ